jgi:CRP/FNR family transcriptional regulator, cyclic AMP receptor protein
MAAARILAQEYKVMCRNLKRLTLPASVPARVANLLLDWTEEHAPDPMANGHCLMPLTHEEIALMIASTRETVTRILGRLKRDQVISFRGAALTVLQPQALQQLAN